MAEIYRPYIKGVNVTELPKKLAEWILTPEEEREPATIFWSPTGLIRLGVPRGSLTKKNVNLFFIVPQWKTIKVTMVPEWFLEWEI